MSENSAEVETLNNLDYFKKIDSIDSKLERIQETTNPDEVYEGYGSSYSFATDDKKTEIHFLKRREFEDNGTPRDIYSIDITTLSSSISDIKNELGMKAAKLSVPEGSYEVQRSLEFQETGNWIEKEDRFQLRLSNALLRINPTGITKEGNTLQTIVLDTVEAEDILNKVDSKVTEKSLH